MYLEERTKQILGIAAAVAGAGLVVGGIVYAVKHAPGTLARIDHRKAAKRHLKGKVEGDGGTVEIYQGKIPIRERLGLMQEMTARSVQDPDMIRLARKITAGCPDRDQLCALRKIYDFKKSHLRYILDPAPHRLSKAQGGEIEGIDLFPSARQVLEMGGDDCDGHTVFGSTMGILNGIPMKFEVFAPVPSLQENYEHVADAGQVNGEWVFIDSTVPGEFFGTLPPAMKSLGMEVTA